MLQVDGSIELARCVFLSLLSWVLPAGNRKLFILFVTQLALQFYLL